MKSVKIDEKISTKMKGTCRIAGFCLRQLILELWFCMGLIRLNLIYINCMIIGVLLILAGVHVV
jgi:hypothetical protein